MLVAAEPFALSLTIVVALVYLGLVRLADLNEKEPLWALATALFLGVVGAGVVALLVDDEVLELTVFQSSLAIELARFAAVAATLFVFHAIARVRGWAEVNGLTDGIVYGVAVGLGFAAGDVLVAELARPDVVLREVGSFDVLWTALLDGLAGGLYGALIGAGFGLAVTAKTELERYGYPLAGLVAAILAHMALLQLSTGDALGSGGQVRKWLALLIPLAALVALMVVAPLRERRWIRRQLESEVRAGFAAPEELALLLSPLARRREYARRLAAGDFDGWAALRTLHNRLVQLALVKERALTATDAAAADAEAERLRAQVNEARRSLELASPRVSAESGA